MKAGRELDALVAEKVMGWRYNIRNENCWAMTTQSGYEIFAPSTDIAAAWVVVEKLHPSDGFALSYRGLQHTPVSWEASLAMGTAMAETPALAICLAALKAVGHEVSA